MVSTVHAAFTSAGPWLLEAGGAAAPTAADAHPAAAVASPLHQGRTKGQAPDQAGS